MSVTYDSTLPIGGEDAPYLCKKESMKHKILLLLLALQVLSKSGSSQPCKEVIGYYPNWQWYDRNKLVRPNTINYSKYSIINYCFFKPEANGIISNTDAWADENLLQGQINWNTTPVSYYPNTSVIDLAHNAGTKVMVSIGGWTLSDNFPSIAASATLRGKFASECNRLIKFYKFDGIDIDWEYPGYAQHSGTAADKVNFTLLLDQIRDSLTALGALHNKTYKLSACFSGDPANMQNIEWNNIVPILDMINLMSYDFFGTWDCKANHNAPLYAPTSGNPNFNCNTAFLNLVNTYSVPSTKINLGVAFYGRSQMGATGLHQTTNCTENNVVFADDLGTPLYYNVVKNMSLFDKYFDNVAKVPYLLGKSTGSASGTFVSYDDKFSIGLKAQYIKDQNARGAIIWEITGDYLETFVGSGQISGTPLADTLNQVFCSNSSTVSTGIAKANAELSDIIFPNPSSGLFTISTLNAIEKIEVKDVLGKNIMNFTLEQADKNTYHLTIPEQGVYLLVLHQRDKIRTLKVIKH